MHLLARTVSGLREELVVRDHSENFCIQGHHLRSIRFLLSLGCFVMLQAVSRSPDGWVTNNVRRGFLSFPVGAHLIISF